MAGERTLNFGADETDARWQVEDAGDGGNFVLARDLDGAVVLLEYDTTNSEWVSRGPVNMDGNDLSNVGTVDATAVNTDQTRITQTGKFLLPERDEITSQDKTVTVDPDAESKTVNIGGTDYKYWVPDIPRTVAHQLIFNIPDGDYSDISIYIPPFTLADAVDRTENEGFLYGAMFKGDTTTPTNVKFKSLSMSGVIGSGAARIEGLNFVGETPATDETVGVMIHGSTHPFIEACSFVGTSASIGVTSYSSNITIEENTHLGNDDLITGVQSKHQGTILINNGGVQGSVTGQIIDQRAFGQALVADNSASGDLVAGRNGIVIDDTSNKTYLGRSLVINSIYPRSTEIRFRDDQDNITLESRHAGDVVIQPQQKQLFAVKTQDSTGSDVNRVVIRGGSDIADMELQDSVRFKNPVNNSTTDSMTADPETDSESGYIEIDINGTIRQIPFYDA